jgi:transcriptional regulator with XRE-family HTH domain
MITGPQLRAARELIGLSQLSLAVQFQLGLYMSQKSKPLVLRALIDFEAGKNSLSWQTLHHLRRALEAASLEFTNGRPGVMLRKTK